MEILSKELFVEGLDVDDDDGRQLRREVAGRNAEVKRPEMWSPGLILGQEYSSPLLIPDSVSRPAESVTEFEPTLATGLRLPHAWLSESRSLFDALGREFTLLVLDRRTDISPIVTAAAARKVPLTVLPLDDPTPQGLLSSPLVLVRPDRIVAWHGQEPTDIDLLWDTVIGSPLSQQEPIRTATPSELTHRT
ncbi:hypothetical protein [Georgenia sp. AZ-5]|uniref:aromatic-ring hydroxylase C-terminal domain-containing protein n=1 Tax=Georgenia sp. AZ-5 TaxID=3367526 RepID=UPI00375536D6